MSLFYSLNHNPNLIQIYANGDQIYVHGMNMFTFTQWGEHYPYMYYPYATFIGLVKITCKNMIITPHIIFSVNSVDNTKHV